MANVICGGLANDHDFDLARLRLLDGLYAMGGVRTDVWRDYSNADAIAKGDLLVSYWSLIVADAEQQWTLRRYVEGGPWWFAIHATLERVAVDRRPVMRPWPSPLPLRTGFTASQPLASACVTAAASDVASVGRVPRILLCAHDLLPGASLVLSAQKEAVGHATRHIGPDNLTALVDAKSIRGRCARYVNRGEAVWAQTESVRHTAARVFATMSR